MAARPPVIHTYGARCLRCQAVAVEPAAPETAALLDDLWLALDADGGVGLAAPQIARNRRVLVVREPGRSGVGRRLELLNPELVETFGPVAPFEEGCLSFPGLYATVWRPQGVEVRFRDRTGREQILREEGLVARIVQHEIDHLDGILFIDRVPARWRWRLAPRLLWLWLRGTLAGA